MQLLKVSFKRIIFIALALVLLIVILISSKNKILTLNRPVEAKVLVIEGWLRSFDLELIKKNINLEKYEMIYVTGIAHDHPQYMLNNPKSQLDEMPTTLGINGCLGLRENAINTIIHKDTISIQVFAYATKALEEYAHFVVTIGDQKIGDTFAAEKPGCFTYKTTIPLTADKGIFIYYDNDLYYHKQDRNLTIDSVIVNGTCFKKTDDFYKIYDNHLDDNLYTNYPFRSNAVASANYLKAIGVKNEIVVVDTFYNKRNKTLTTATRFANLLKSIHPKIDAFNVVSIHDHSRRTFLSYQTAFSSNKPKIGIISIDDRDFGRKKPLKERVHHFFKEYFSLLITWIIWIVS